MVFNWTIISNLNTFVKVLHESTYFQEYILSNIIEKVLWYHLGDQFVRKVKKSFSSVHLLKSYVRNNLKKQNSIKKIYVLT